MNIGSPRIAFALLLRLAALTLLVLAAVGRPWPPPGAATQVVLLSDRSASVDAAELDRARAEVLQGLRDTASATAVLELEFAGRTAPLRAPAAHAGAASRSREDIEPLATDLEAALREALSSVAATRPAALVVLSDGLATRGDTRRALEGAAATGVPLLWRTVPPDASAPRIVAVHAPADAQPQQPIAVGIELGGAAARTRDRDGNGPRPACDLRSAVNRCRPAGWGVAVGTVPGTGHAAARRHAHRRGLRRGARLA